MITPEQLCLQCRLCHSKFILYAVCVSWTCTLCGVVSYKCWQVEAAKQALSNLEVQIDLRKHQLGQIESEEATVQSELEQAKERQEDFPDQKSSVSGSQKTEILSKSKAKAESTSGSEVSVFVKAIQFSNHEIQLSNVLPLRLVRLQLEDLFECGHWSWYLLTKVMNYNNSIVSHFMA